MFPNRNGFKQGDALKPLLFNFALDYAIRRVQVNQDGLKSNGKQQLLVYADDVTMLCGNVYTINKNIESVLVGSREIGLEVNVDKTKYMVIFEIRMQDEVTLWILVIVPLKGWKN